MIEVAHRTFYADGSIRTCAECGADWYEARDEPPMFMNILSPTDDPTDGVLTTSVWGVTCDECGAQYAQINLYSTLFKNE